MALSIVIPYEVIDGQALFMWQLLGELPPAAVLASFAPALAGIGITAAALWSRRSASLAVVTLACLGTMVLLVRAGAEAASWDVLALPENLTRRPTLGLVPLALTAAGSALAYRDRARSASAAMLGGAALLASISYVWPAQGDSAAMHLARLLASLPGAAGWRYQLGVLMVALLSAFPLVIPLAGLIHLLRKPGRPFPLTAVVATYGLPAILLMLTYRSVATATGIGVLGALGGAAVAAATLALLGGAFEIVGERLTSGERLETTRGWSLRRVSIVAALTFVVVGLAPTYLGRDPKKGVVWQLRAPSAEADELFGSLLPKWAAARGASMDGEIPPNAMESSEHARNTAHAVDERLHLAVVGLTKGTYRHDLAGRHWYRLVSDINDASRRAGMPYYLDPQVRIRASAEGLERQFGVVGYRIDQVRRFDAGGQQVAALHLRRLSNGPSDDNVRLLGFSRDLQPFALIVLDEVEPFAQELERLADSTPPACGYSDSPAWRPTLELCGGVLAALGTGAPLRALLLADTERHELQHQLDGPRLRMAQEVLRAIPAESRDVQRRVNREVSAYLAEMAESGPSARLGLVHLLRLAWLGPDDTSALIGRVGLRILAGRVGVMSAGAAADGEAREDFSHLAVQPGPTLQQSAARAWAQLYGRPLPRVEAARSPAED